MDADYERLIAQGLVHVIGDPIEGMIVLVPKADHLLVENVAVFQPPRAGAWVDS